jgi:hypothetical protein
LETRDQQKRCQKVFIFLKQRIIDMETIPRRDLQNLPTESKKPNQKAGLNA